MATEEKSENWIKERRQDHERRLSHAVRKAHDPLFTQLKKPDVPAAATPGDDAQRRR